MELQNQIYLLITVFGSVCILLLVFIVILAIYVINVKKLVSIKEPERKYDNYGFEHEAAVRNISDDLRVMKTDTALRPPYKSNLSKPRNDDTSNHNNGRRKEKRPTGGGGHNDRKRNYSESGDTSGRDFDSAFDNEINNMFDIDDDDDQDSVVSDRNSRYNQRNGRQGQPPPPPLSTGAGHNNAGNRNRNFNQGGANVNRHANKLHPMSTPAEEITYHNSKYLSGNTHEGKTYFNDRGINY